MLKGSGLKLVALSVTLGSLRGGVRAVVPRFKLAAVIVQSCEDVRAAGLVQLDPDGLLVDAS